MFSQILFDVVHLLIAVAPAVFSLKKNESVPVSSGERLLHIDP